MKILQLAASALLLATSHAANNSGVSSKLMVHVSERPLKRPCVFPSRGKRPWFRALGTNSTEKCHQTNPLTVFLFLFVCFCFVCWNDYRSPTLFTRKGDTIIEKLCLELHPMAELLLRMYTTQIRICVTPQLTQPEATQHVLTTNHGQLPTF